MKKIILLMLFLNLSVNIVAQKLPILNVTSPEVAGLGQYGTIPVSLFTGVPDISIPLHEVKIGQYTLPIYVSYHLASIRPNDQSGCLGLGWSLFAGGYITRDVRGIYDEKLDKDEYAPGFYAHASKLKGIINSRFEAETEHFSGDEKDYYELSADEFAFNFCGYSGNFYYNEDGGWSVISEHDIKVEFNPTFGEGFINLTTLKQRIQTSMWGQAYNNNRFFNKFTLITPDGCRYTFGGLQATEFSIPYYYRNSNDLIPTTWRLSKITTADKRVIEFTYDSSSLMCDLRYVPQHKIVYSLPCTHSNPGIGRAGMTGHLLFPVNLKSIKTSNEVLEFNYFSDLGYSGRFVDQFLAWRTQGYGRQDIYNGNMPDPANQFHVFMNNINADTEYDMIQSIKANLNKNILHSIVVKKNDLNFSKTIYFDYQFNNRRKLSLITERVGARNPMPNWVMDGHGIMWLSGYNIPDPDSYTDFPEYKFYYNKSSVMPMDYVRPTTDSWGYYNGGSVEFAAHPSFSMAYPVLEYTKAEVLTEIVYPTGGKTQFDYQLNDYSKRVSTALTSLENYSGNAGGLRIHTIKNLDIKDNVLGIKKYYYAESMSANSKSSGILKRMPTFEVKYYTTNGVTLILKSQGGFFPSVTNLNSPNVGYSCVIEETLNAEGESLGYVKHRFSNYDMDIHGSTHLDEPAIYSMATGDSYINPYTSRSMDRGKLMAKEYFKKNGQQEKSITYKYKEVNSGFFKTANQITLFFCSDPYFFSIKSIGSLTKTYMHSYLPDSIIDVSFVGNAPIRKEQSFSYNQHKLIKNETVKTSAKGTYFTEYLYPSDFSEYQWMVTQNILSPVIEKKEQEGNSSKWEIYNYSSKNNIPYLSRYSTAVNSKNNSHTEYKVNVVDQYGNPVEITEKGISKVLIWGFEGQRLLAKIENATHSQVESALKRKPESFSPLSYAYSNYVTIENNRHKLPFAHFYIYKYNPNLILQSITLPNGITTLYKYDTLERFREEYFWENSSLLGKRVLNVYDYHYYNGIQGGGDFIGIEE